MALGTNTAEGLADGAIPTTSNTGGASGVAASAVSQGVASTIRAKAAAAIFGVMGYQFTLTGTGGADGPCRILFNLATAGRAVAQAYVELDGGFTAFEDIGGIRHSSGNMTILTIGDDSKPVLFNSSGGGVSASRAPNPVTAGRYCFQWAATKGTTASNGTLEYAYWDIDVDTVNPVYTWSDSAQNAGTANAVSVFFGRSTGRNVAHVLDYDNLAWQDLATGWLPVEAPATNTAPTADAGPDQTAEPYTVATLNGTGSTDPDGDPLTYAWTQTAGTTVTLSDPASVQPSFTAPATLDGDVLTFSLTVNDGTADSAPDTTDVTVPPHTWWQITDPAIPTLAPIRASTIA